MHDLCLNIPLMEQRLTKTKQELQRQIALKIQNAKKDLEASAKFKHPQIKQALIKESSAVISQPSSKDKLRRIRSND